MKANLAAGSEIEIVTPGELRQILGELFPSRSGPQSTRPVEAATLDASGDATIALYTVPAGMQFTLHWLTIEAETFTPAAPYTSADGYAEILQAGNMRDFVTFANGLPAVWSSSVGVRYHEKEAVQVSIVGGPNGKAAILRGEGVLAPLTLT